MQISRALLLISLALSVALHPGRAQTPQPDSDSDGLNDALEQALLEQFAPRFMIGRQDCAGVPAEFQPGLAIPDVLAENGTIYGQVSPYGGGQVSRSKYSTPQKPVVEIHYYHLWRVDCGPHGHQLDTEHVATLVQASGDDLATATWRAEYWYAAAHENTVCDVSQITRASTLHAEEHGAKVWISPGKHASYLNGELCRHGCGADHCEAMVPLQVSKIVNLGELGHPMNGSVFVTSNRWPLAAKMSTSNFPEAPRARLDQLPGNDIAWFNPGRHPAQQTIAVSGTTEDAIALGGRATDVAVSLAEDSTGNALQKSYRHTVHALGVSAKHVGEALHAAPKRENEQPEAQQPLVPSPPRR